MAFKEIAADYEKKTGTKVVSTFGSTGMLAKQIAEGAKYDAFFAANVSFVEDVIKAGACDAATRRPTRAAVSWSGARIELQPEARGARRAALRQGRHRQPRARALRARGTQALETAGVWETVKPKLVFGENVQQTLQYAQTGNVEAAMVALSLAIAPRAASIF